MNTIRKAWPFLFIITAALGAGALYFLLMFYNWPLEGWSGQPIVIFVAIIALLGFTVWALWPPFYEWYHVVGGIATGVGAILLFEHGSPGDGWGTLLTASGLIIVGLALLALAVAACVFAARRGHPWK